jgi:hypothetical protein
VIVFLLIILLWLLLGAFGVSAGVSKEAVCSKCSYPTMGHQSERCPECGSELAGAGTRPAGRGKWEWVPTRGVSLVYVSLLALGGTIGIIVGLYSACPRTYRDTLSFVASHDEGATWSLELISSGSAVKDATDYAFNRAPSCARGHVRVWLHTSDGRSGSLEIIDTRHHARYRTAEGSVSTLDALSVQDVRSWAGQIKDSAAREQVIRDAHAIAGLIFAACTGTYDVRAPVGIKITGQEHHQYAYPVLYRSLPIMIVWLAAAAGGIGFTYRKGLPPIVLWA